MPKHIKPTKEELEANALRALEEAEALEQEENKDKPELPTELPEEEIPEKIDEEDLPKLDEEEEEEETPTPEVKPVVDPVKPEEESEEDKTYKEKFSNSTREAQILYSKNKKTTELLEQASQLPEPTEEELKAVYKDWDVMGDFERQMAKDSLIGKRYREFIANGTKEFKDIDAWVSKVDEFIDDPATLVKIPELEGKQDEFKAFANKPTRRGVDFEDLVSAFLFDASKNVKLKNKGSMFEQGTGGPNDKPSNAPKKLTADQGSALRKQNYRLWLQYSKAGKIDSEI